MKLSDHASDLRAGRSVHRAVWPAYSGWNLRMPFGLRHAPAEAIDQFWASLGVARRSGLPDTLTSEDIAADDWSVLK